MSTIPIIKQSINNKAKRMHFNVSKVSKARLRPQKISNTALICRAKVQLSLKKHLRQNISFTYKIMRLFNSVREFGRTKKNISKGTDCLKHIVMEYWNFKQSMCKLPPNVMKRRSGRSSKVCRAKQICSIREKNIT